MGDDFLLIGMVMAIVIVGGGLLFLINRFQPKKRLDSRWFATQWQVVEGQFADGLAGQALAVVNADKLLDRAMRDKGFRGQTMGERLKGNPKAFADVNAIWRAHKLRNRIAHDHTQVYEAECRSALATFRQGLRDLGVSL